MSRSSTTKLLSMLCLLSLAGCAGHSGTTSGFGDVWPEPDPEQMVVTSNGMYGVQYRVIGETGGIPTNDRFWLYVFPFQRNAEGWQRATDVYVNVDAAMPHHGHGMNVVPSVTKLSDGYFSVEGMLLHMPGRWELYFDITRKGVTERAQTEVFLE